MAISRRISPCRHHWLAPLPSVMRREHCCMYRSPCQGAGVGARPSSSSEAAAVSGGAGAEGGCAGSDGAVATPDVLLDGSVPDGRRAPGVAGARTPAGGRERLFASPFDGGDGALPVC